MNPHPADQKAEADALAAYVPAPVGTVRGPFTTGDPRRPSVSFMVQGPGGWVPITRPHRSRDESECHLAAESYAAEVLNPDHSKP